MSFFYKEDGYPEVKVAHVVFAIIGIIIVIAVALIATNPLFAIYGRYQVGQNKNLERAQALADAQNQVSINAIIIQQQEQNIQVEKQKAQIRVVDAQGISDAQKIIAASLTDSYLQYLAIDAQKAMAAGQNHTEVYIPTGTNGIPLVKTINPSGN